MNLLKNNYSLLGTFLIISFLIFTSCVKTKVELKLNDVQVIGSHNSYKIPIEKPLWNYLYSLDSTKAKSLQ